MNNGQSNFNSDFLFILLLLVSIICLDEQLVIQISAQFRVAAVYLVGTTRSGLTQVPGLYLLLSIQTAFKTQMPDSKVPGQDSVQCICSIVYMHFSDDS